MFTARFNVQKFLFLPIQFIYVFLCESQNKLYDVKWLML